MSKSKTYIHEQPGWSKDLSNSSVSSPDFSWDLERLLPLLVEVHHRQGRLMGHMDALGFSVQSEAVLKTLTQDVLKSSEIEGEHLDQGQVRSSIARRLGLDVGGLPPVDHNVEGIVEMMLDATNGYDSPLDALRLFNWHSALFPTGRSGMLRITVGAWRTAEAGPMQVVSGAMGREKVHYEAPEAARVAPEMERFLHWFETDQSLEPVLKSALAHLWFVTIHPFEDGNGRIARTLADMLLARSEGSSQRFYSMSAQIQQERKVYYEMLEQTQKGSLDVTEWMLWFLGCLFRSLEAAEVILDKVLAKSRFWERVAKLSLNARQRIVMNRLLDGFEGKLTTSKWAKIAKCSQDTASRDIRNLIAQDILFKSSGGGRSTSYELKEIGEDSEYNGKDN